MTLGATAWGLALALALAAAASAVHATRFYFHNECPQFIYIPANGPVVVQDAARPGLMWRHGYNPQATLAEFSIVGDGKVWYDISIIPPGPDWCFSYEDCRAYTGRKGFNVPMAILPRRNVDAPGFYCRPLYCLYDGCPDAYHFPADNSKVRSCPETTEFSVVFCPNGTTPSGPTATLGSTGYTRAVYSYRGRHAGNGLGSYDMVTSLAGCRRQRVTRNSPVGPLSEDVSMVFRGPMEIFNIAVFDNPLGLIWRRVSWYKRGGDASNLLFMNNMNIDYSGRGLHGPQIFASSDGRTGATSPQRFLGSLAEASDPSRVGAGPGITTGVEVNIVTAQRCTGATCSGYWGGSYAFRGWGSGKKIFVVRLQMPRGSRPDQPAMWMLNSQVLQIGQYSGCNCRGMGAAGGCGELDIAEVIETNAARDRISTHYYFYDGSTVSPAGDNFASRPIDKPTTYVTVIDDSRDGVIKILEIDDGFDFDSTALLSRAQVQQWINA
ncbi:hypothetical protein ATCC90586_003428 [Pythium insidiosum]|nr:hypothetical protein ATCC90586_003428 [Pythium insidiosum]